MKIETFYLHIGLPKTATTFLQNAVFKKLNKISYVGRKEASRYFEETHGMPFRQAFSGDANVWTDTDAKGLRAFISEYAGEGTGLLVSEENISVTARFFDEPASEVEPQEILSHIRAMREAARAVGVGTFKLIISIRRQDTWLASRYAQSAPRFNDAGQKHFEKCVQDIVTGRQPFKARALWIDYGYLSELFGSELGHSNVLILPQERLRVDADGTLSRLGEFLGEKRLGERVASAGRKRAGPTNSVGDRLWALRQRDGTVDEGQTIRLSEELENEILQAYASSNRKASDSFDLGLDEYGYF